MERTTVYFPDDLRRRMAEFSRRTGKPQSRILREAVASYLDRAGRPEAGSIGAGDNPEFSSEKTKEWLREHWTR
jgi:predicted transcriptional regulator